MSYSSDSLPQDHLHYELSDFQYEVLSGCIDKGNPFVSVQTPDLTHSPDLRAHLAIELHEVTDLVTLGLLEHHYTTPGKLQIYAITETGLSIRMTDQSAN